MSAQPLPIASIPTPCLFVFGHFSVTITTQRYRGRPLLPCSLLDGSRSEMKKRISSHMRTQLGWQVSKIRFEINPSNFNFVFLCVISLQRLKTKSFSLRFSFHVGCFPFTPSHMKAFKEDINPVYGQICIHVSLCI